MKKMVDGYEGKKRGHREYALIGVEIGGVIHGTFIEYYDYRNFFYEAGLDVSPRFGITFNLERHLMKNSTREDKEIQYFKITGKSLKEGIQRGEIVPIHSLRVGLKTLDAEDMSKREGGSLERALHIIRVYIDRAYVFLYSELYLDITSAINKFEGLATNNNKETNRGLWRGRVFNILERLVISRFEYDQLEAHAHNTKANSDIIEEVSGRKMGNRRFKSFVKGLGELFLAMQTTNRWTYSDENESILFVRQVELHNMVNSLLKELESELFDYQLVVDSAYHISEEGREYGSLTLLKKRQDKLLDLFERVLSELGAMIISLEQPTGRNESNSMRVLKEKFRSLYAQENLRVTPIGLIDKHTSLWKQLELMRGK